MLRIILEESILVVETKLLSCTLIRKMRKTLMIKIYNPFAEELS